MRVNIIKFQVAGTLVMSNATDRERMIRQQIQFKYELKSVSVFPGTLFKILSLFIKYLISPELYNLPVITNTMKNYRRKGINLKHTRHIYSYAMRGKIYNLRLSGFISLSSLLALQPGKDYFSRIFDFNFSMLPALSPAQTNPATIIITSFKTSLPAPDR